MIRFDNVRFRYGSKTILEDLSFAAEPGKCTVLAGPNGIGKSTALALAAGALLPCAGAVIREGEVGYSPQEVTLFSDLSVLDNLKFFASLRGAAVPERTFLPVAPVLRKKVSKLSGGMQKRVSIVCAELGNPENLLLDEPCIGLDIAAQDMLFTQIEVWKKQGCSILYAAHNAAEIAAVCDRLVLLGSGRCRILERSEIDDFDSVLHTWIENG